MTWIDDVDSGIRLQKLKNIGVEGKLIEMLLDSDIDVKDRVKTALSHFNAAEMTMDDVRFNNIAMSFDRRHSNDNRFDSAFMIIDHF